MLEQTVKKNTHTLFFVKASAAFPLLNRTFVSGHDPVPLTNLTQHGGHAI